MCEASTCTKKPKLIGFDLDFTLWPFWVDTHVDPLFNKNGKGQVVDSRGRKVKVFPEVDGVLRHLVGEGYVLAAVSRTGEVEGANQLLQLFDWDRYFTYKEIYPGCKITHFTRIKEASGMEFNEMLFFDDEERNKRDLATIGVLMIMVHNGVTANLVKHGLRKYARE